MGVAICAAYFFVPQHLLVKPGKKERLIFYAKYRHLADSIPVNMMTSTDKGIDFPCAYKDVINWLLSRICDLRITYLDIDIVTHANNVKVL